MHHVFTLILSTSRRVWVSHFTPEGCFHVNRIRNFIRERVKPLSSIEFHFKKLTQKISLALVLWLEKKNSPESVLAMASFRK